jgi:hypothetical protein
MLPNRFSFGDPDEPPPRKRDGWYARALALALAVVLAALAQLLDFGRLFR